MTDSNQNTWPEQYGQDALEGKTPEQIVRELNEGHYDDLLGRNS